MSLLSQFYPSGSGGPYPFPNPAVPPMTLGGFTSNPHSRVYGIGAGFFLPSAVTPVVGSLTSGWASLGFLGAPGVVGEFKFLNPVLSTMIESLGAFQTISITYTGEGALVFENCIKNGSGNISLTVNQINSIYGLAGTMLSGGVASISADSSLENWYLGDLSLFGNSTLTIDASNLVNVETCRFLIPGSQAALMDFSGTSLNQASVDKVLVDNDGSATAGPGTIDLGGGCAEPGPAGLAAAASLQSKGLTIITN